MARPALIEKPVKLTLYMESTTRSLAKAVARQKGLSTSALFTRLVEAEHKNLNHVAPVQA